MEVDWSDCPLIESDPEKVHGEPVFKGTRLPAETITDNVHAFLNEGFSLDQAIGKTLESFPSVPNGAHGIRTIFLYQSAYEGQPVA